MIDNELDDLSEPQEAWKQIDQFSRYWISNLGKVYNASKHKLVTAHPDYSGYLLVDIRRDDGVTKSKRVHRLVAEAFLPNWNPEWPWTVNHINGNKDDNRLINLEMLTTADNNRHYQTAECFEESRKSVRDILSVKMKKKCSDPEYVAQMSTNMKNVWKDPKNREMYIDCLRKRHADPNERKHISDKMKEVCADADYRQDMSDRQKKNWENPEYRAAIANQNHDRMWVHDDTNERWIHESELSDYLANGYLVGRNKSRLCSSTKGKIRISKDTQSKFVSEEDLDSYLNTDWVLGTGNTKQVKCIQTGEVFSSAEACAEAFNVSADLIHARCKGATRNYRKLKEFDFCYCEKEV